MLTCDKCIWDGLNGETRVCKMRDHLKSDEDTLSYPENPGLGCDEKKVLYTSVNGNILLGIEQILIGPPSGYSEA